MLDYQSNYNQAAFYQISQGGHANPWIMAGKFLLVNEDNRLELFKQFTDRIMIARDLVENV